MIEIIFSPSIFRRRITHELVKAPKLVKILISILSRVNESLEGWEKMIYDHVDLNFPSVFNFLFDFLWKEIKIYSKFEKMWVTPEYGTLTLFLFVQQMNH